MKTYFLLFVLVTQAFASATAHAQTARDRFLQRIDSGSFGFLAATRFDLSRHTTAARTQGATGWCVSFSTIGAVEARFNHKYCEPGTMNAYRAAGYCGRYDGFTRVPFWIFNGRNGDNYLSMTKELNLSEHYYTSRLFTQATAQAGYQHETLTVFNFGDGMPANSDVLMAQQSLPEEWTAPFIDDNEFWAPTGVRSIFAYMNPANFPQWKIDQVDFSETPFPSFLPGSPINRVSVPLDARKNARFKVTDALHGRLSTFGVEAERVRFLERAIYSGYEVALHGAQPGHSMLLVGYDRSTKMFFFKDSYYRWVTVPYSVAANAGATYTVIMDVSYEAAPSKEEMWPGQWELDDNGQVGTLTLRRTRRPTNSYWTPSNLYEQNMPEMSRTLWARVGSYMPPGTRSTYAVYGRLGYDGDDGTMELSIDRSRLEPTASSIAQHTAGFSPSAEILNVTLFTTGPGTAAYAVGTKTLSGRNFGVLMRRLNHNELGSVPHYPDSRLYFTRSAWEQAGYRLTFEDGSSGTLYVAAPASGAPSAWYYDSATGIWVVLNGSFGASDNDITFYTSDTRVPKVQSLRVIANTGELGVVTGMDQNWRPLFGTQY